MKLFPFLIVSVLLGAPPAWAAVPTETTAAAALQQQIRRLTETVQRLQDTVQAQQQRLVELERASLARASAPAAAPSAVLSAPSAPVYRLGSGANLSPFNPEIGVVGNILGKLSSSSADEEGNDKLSVKELELVFGHPVDPYSRFDATITFSDIENPDIEEAYLTHWGLPGEITARLGRMRPKIGKATATHGERLETVDYPLVVQRDLGKEGLFRTGLEVSGFIPAPWTAVTHELTVGLMEGGVGDGGSLFGSTRRRPSLYAHLKNFWDISDASNLELGTTYLLGSKDADRAYEVQALGLDATFIHHVTSTNRLKWQHEVYLQHRTESVVASDTGTVSSPNTPLGFYSLLDYRLSPRFGVGGRFDYAEPIDVNPSTLVRHADTAWTGYLTLFQSELAQWRLQFKHTDFAAGGDDNSIFAQATVTIGVDKHPLQ